MAGLLIAFSASATSFTITTITRVPGYFAGTGGEFTVVPGDATGQSFLNNGYVPATEVSVGGVLGWQSFCMEQHEGLHGGPYTGILNDRAINGGVGPAGDPLSIGVAWLYAKFATGTLPLYDYTVGVGRPNSARALQQAIWFLEDEIVSVSDPTFLNMAIAKFGTLAAAHADNNGTYPVDVINVYGPNRLLQQDQLVLTKPPGSPDGGAALMLLGMGLTSLALFSRITRK